MVQRMVTPARVPVSFPTPMRGDERHKLETDALILRVERTMDWAQANRRSLVTIVAATVGLGLLVGGFLVNRGNRKDAARTRLGFLTAEIQRSDGRGRGAARSLRGLALRTGTACGE